MKSRHPFTPRPLFLALALVPALLLAAPALFATTKVVHLDFESGKAPKGGASENVSLSIDKARAHSGASSLMMTATKKRAWGDLAFDIGKIDFSANHEVSVWAYTENSTKVSVYIAATDTSGESYTVVHATDTIEPGTWTRLSGKVYAGDWRKNDTNFKLVVRTLGTCWVDDLQLVSGLPETPAQVWPGLKKALHASADKRVSTLAPGGTLTLDARNAVLAPDTARADVALPSTATAVVPADGMLVFAVDAKEDLDLTGSIELDPDANLRPGLRATVLSDDTVIAAPGVKSPAPWRGMPENSKTPGAVPAGIVGERPSPTVSLNHWRVARGRHYIAIASPHFRTAGTFAKLELRAKPRAAEKPIYTFAFLSDTHLGFGRMTRNYSKLNARNAEQLEATLRDLKGEGVEFAILGGDMTDRARRSQYEDLARAIKNAGLPVYGCIGNHDTLADSRTKIIPETIPHLFPNGPDKTEYAFSRPPLRFIVLDGSYWTGGKDGKIHGHRVRGASRLTYSAGMIDWLRETLAKDTESPTIVISHYRFFTRGGISTQSGNNRGKSAMDKPLMTALDAAPNVVATMNGHHHTNTVGVWHGITSMQNSAFAVWPNAYRVCRVYPDRMEWEVRQIPNRGLIRESIVSNHATLASLSFFEDDLGGTISLAPRKPASAAKK